MGGAGRWRSELERGREFWREVDRACGWELGRNVIDHPDNMNAGFGEEKLGMGVGYMVGYWEDG